MSGLRTLGYLTLDAPPADTIDAAGTAGFASVGIRISGRWRDDPWTPVIGNRKAIADLRTRAADQGVRLSNISSYHIYPHVTVDDLARVMETSAELGAGTVVTNGYDPDLDVYVEKLQRYCELGNAAGVRVGIEFMKYSEVRTIHDARRVVERVGAANLGIVVDALHLTRSGGTPADVRTVDARLIAFAQLCDARTPRHAPTTDELRREARTERLYPGDGDLPLREFLAAFPPGTEIEYEVPRQNLGSLTLAQRARVAYSAFEWFMDSGSAAWRAQSGRNAAGSHDLTSPRRA